MRRSSRSERHKVVRILLVVHRFPPDSVGGTELYTLRLAQGLMGMGFDVQVLTYAPGNTAEVVSQDTEYLGIPLRHLSFSLDSTDNPILQEYDNARVAARLREACADFRPDLLHVTHFGYLSTSVIVGAEALGIPSVATITDMWPLCPAGLLLRSDDTLCEGPGEIGACVQCYAAMGPRGAPYASPVRLIPEWAWRGAAAFAKRGPFRSMRYMPWLNALVQRPDVIRERLLKCRAILCPGNFLREMLVRNGYPAERLQVVPHGIETPHALRRRTPIATEPILRFGYVGQLAPHKGAHLPLRSFVRMPSDVSTSLIYWGPLPEAKASNPYSRSLVRRIDGTLGASHRGAYAYKDVRNVMEGLDVLIVPSLCYENTPTIIYEALASGTPVIASDQGGMRELVREYDGGWLFPRGNVAALAKLMARLTNDRQEVRCVAAGIRPVPSLETHIQKVSLLYRQILGQGDNA